MPGYFTPGLPLVGSVASGTYYPRLSGNERIPMDTNSQQPASVAVSPFQLAAFAAAVMANTGTSTAGAATVNTENGLITTEALTTAAGATYTFTLTNSLIGLTSTVEAAVYPGTDSTGVPIVTNIVVNAGNAVLTIQNAGTAALNGTLKIAFSVAQF